MPHTFHFPPAASQVIGSKETYVPVARQTKVRRVNIVPRPRLLASPRQNRRSFRDAGSFDLSRSSLHGVVQHDHGLARTTLLVRQAQLQGDRGDAARGPRRGEKQIRETMGRRSEVRGQGEQLPEEAPRQARAVAQETEQSVLQAD